MPFRWHSISYFLHSENIFETGHWKRTKFLMFFWSLWCTARRQTMVRFTFSNTKSISIKCSCSVWFNWWLLSSSGVVNSWIFWNEVRKNHELTDIMKDPDLVSCHELSKWVHKGKPSLVTSNESKQIGKRCLRTKSFSVRSLPTFCFKCVWCFECAKCVSGISQQAIS